MNINDVSYWWNNGLHAKLSYGKKICPPPPAKNNAIILSQFIPLEQITSL
jgi:hypothetical protein